MKTATFVAKGVVSKAGLKAHDVKGQVFGGQHGDCTKTVHYKKLQQPYFDEVCSGLKTIEGRTNSGSLQSIQAGHILVFQESAGPKEVAVRVKQVEQFPSFQAMLLHCGVQPCLPSFTGTFNEAVELYHAFPGFQERARQDGVLALYIELFV